MGLSCFWSLVALRQLPYQFRTIQVFLSYFFCDLLLCYTKVRSPSILKFDVYFTVLRCGSSSNYKTLMSYSFNKHVCSRLQFTKHWGHLPFIEHIEVTIHWHSISAQLNLFWKRLSIYIVHSPYKSFVIGIHHLLTYHLPSVSSLQIAPLSFYVDDIWTAPNIIYLWYHTLVMSCTCKVFINCLRPANLDWL